MNQVKHLPADKQQEKQMGNGSVTWKWVSALLMAVVLSIGGYLYAAMDKKVTAIGEQLADVKTQLAEIKTELRLKR